MVNPLSQNIVSKYFADFTSRQQEQLHMLGPLYREWNEKINVISRKDIESLYEKHVLHSLSIAAVFQFNEGTEIIDLGTGGGFPGIPLAIFFPHVQFHLVDSISKKIKVVEAVSTALELKNITYAHSRIEDIKGRTFDHVVSRAVAPLKTLWQWSRPLLKKGNKESSLICLKGGDLSMEISESGLRPRIYEINHLFPEDFFKEKFILCCQK